MSKEITISVNTGKSIDTTKDLRKEIRNLKNEFYTLEEGTERYNEVFQELSDKTLELKDRNEALRFSARDLGEQLGNTIRVGQGLAAGFETIQATMALFGGESEHLEKVMVKLQAGIALVQGLSGLEGLTKSIPALIASFGNINAAATGLIAKLGALKAAMIATGVGAIAVALGLVIANWDKISNMWTQEKALDNIKQDLDELNKTLEDNARLLKIDEHEAHQRYRQAIIDSKGDVEKMAEAERKLKEELQGVSRELLVANKNAAWKKETEAYQEYIDAVTGFKSIFISSERKKELADAFTEIKKAREDAVRALEEYDLEAAANKVKAESEANQKILEDKKNAYDKYLSDLDAKLKSYGLKGIGDDAFIPNKERLDEGLATLKAALDAKLITEEQYLMAKQQLIQKYNNGSDTFGSVLTPEMRENAEKGMTEHYQSMQATAIKGQAGLFKAIDTGNKQQSKSTEKMWQNSVDITAASLGAMNQLAQAANIESKPLQIAMALMNTYQAANSVMAQQFGGVGAKIAAMITVIGAGLANVISIMNVNPAGEDGATAATPNVRTADMLPTDVLGTTLASNNEVEMQAESAKNTRVYVLESDIANTTNSVKTKVDESRF